MRGTDKTGIQMEHGMKMSLRRLPVVNPHSQNTMLTRWPKRTDLAKGIAAPVLFLQLFVTFDYFQIERRRSSQLFQF
jgi:hypothetical protein